MTESGRMAHDPKWEIIRGAVFEQFKVDLNDVVAGGQMKVFMLTKGSYSDYEVVALFTTRDLAKKYATALATSDRERALKQSRGDLERLDRDGSSWDERQIEELRVTWAKFDSPEEIERKANEIRDKRRNGYLRSIEFYEKPLEMEEIEPDYFGIYRIEEQELYDMVPVVPSDD